ICLLEPNDLLPSTYFERALPLFRSSDVGIVYADVEYIGTVAGRTFTPEFDLETIERDPYLHRGALVRRWALRVADAFQPDQVPADRADWVALRRVIEVGWRADKQPGVIRTFSDPDGEFDRGGMSTPDYFQRAALAAVDVTIFTPLSGRESLWDDY